MATAASAVSMVEASRFSWSPPDQILPTAGNRRSPPSFRSPPSRRSSGGLAVRAAVGTINPAVRKEVGKVVDEVQVAELSKPLTAYCRCWRSGSFPLCDGSHVKHNKETGDNVGPLLLKKQKE